MSSARLRRWQLTVLITLVVGYAGYYVCRANLSVAKLEMGLSKEDLGIISSVGVAFYALGKVTNGLLADFVGGHRLFLLGMALSVICTFLFAMSSSLLAFVFLWALNRYVQSMGWVSLVKVSARWYPVARHATIMGILSLSFLAGDGIARLYLGSTLSWGASWRQMFFIAGLTLAVIFLVSCFTLRSSPEAVGEQEPPANAHTAHAEHGNETRAKRLSELLGPLFRQRAFWLICVINFGLTIIRETFNDWGPVFLKEKVQMDESGAAAMASAAFSFSGAIGAVLAGYFADRLKGSYGWLMLPPILFLMGILALAFLLPLRGNLELAIVLLCGIGFFTLMPYSLAGGVMALDLGGKKGAASASGLIDCAGYLGGMLAGWGIGRVAEDFGWNVAMQVLAGVAAATGLVAAVYWISCTAIGREELTPEPEMIPTQ